MTTPSSNTQASPDMKIFMIGFLGYYSDSYTRIVVAANAEQALDLYRPFVKNRILPNFDQMEEDSPTKFDFYCSDWDYDKNFYIEEIGTGPVSNRITITTG